MERYRRFYCALICIAALLGAPELVQAASPATQKMTQIMRARTNAQLLSAVHPDIGLHYFQHHSPPIDGAPIVRKTRHYCGSKLKRYGPQRIKEGLAVGASGVSCRGMNCSMDGHYDAYYWHFKYYAGGIYLWGVSEQSTQLGRRFRALQKKRFNAFRRRAAKKSCTLARSPCSANGMCVVYNTYRDPKGNTWLALRTKPTGGKKARTLVRMPDGTRLQLLQAGLGYKRQWGKFRIIGGPYRHTVGYANTNWVKPN